MRNNFIFQVSFRKKLDPIHHGSYARLEGVKFHNFNIIPWIAWVLSLVLVFTLPFGLPSLNGLILGAVIYTVLMKITKKQVIKED